MRDDDREQTLFQDQGCGCSLNCLTFVDPSAFAHESCIKVAIHVRTGVLKFTYVVDNDTAVHDVHTRLPSVPQS